MDECTSLLTWEYFSYDIYVAYNNERIIVYTITKLPRHEDRFILKHQQDENADDTPYRFKTIEEAKEFALSHYVSYLI